MSVHRIIPPQEGEVLKLGPPAAGTIIVKVDPATTGSPFVLGTETLLPGAEIPVHRHLQQDEVLFVYKGQGRATLNGQTMTVVPGVMIYVPRQAWHGLRNTGTGLLEITWTSAPPGIEVFFREYARLGDAVSPAALQELAQRCGMELAPPGEAAAPVPPTPHRGRRRRHRGHGDRGHQRDASQATPPSSPSAVAHEPTSQASFSPSLVSTPPPTPSGQTPSPGVASTMPDRPRRRRRRRGGRGTKPPVTGIAPPVARPAQSAPKGTPPSQPSGRPPRRDQRRPGRVKEVYMGGRWVPVVGEGPIIAPGREHSRRSGGRAKRGDEDTPSGPLTVPL